MYMIYINYIFGYKCDDTWSLLKTVNVITIAPVSK